MSLRLIEIDISGTFTDNIPKAICLYFHPEAAAFRIKTKSRRKHMACEFLFLPSCIVKLVWLTLS